MRKRRPAGDGMIRKRTDGRWEGRIVVGKKNDGTPLFKSVLAPTQKELIPKLHSLLETYKDVELTEDSRMPLSKWLNRWLDDFIADAIRPSTMRSYRGLLERHVVPVLGDKSLHNITTGDVQKLYNSLGEGGKNLASSTVRGVHMVLHQALDAAVQQNMMVFNPTEGATIPKLRQPEMQVLNAEQLEIFKEAIKNEPSWYDFFQTEITTGLRRGEICALRWSDFDPRRGILQVNRTLTVEPGGEVRVGEPKTENGKRSILLPKSTADLLRMRKRNSISDWIFPNLFKPEKPMHPGRPYRKLKQILKEADLPQIRFHDLRHTFATHALASGVDAKTLSEILGHAKASFTLDTYTHVTGDMQRNAAAVVEQFMDNLFGEEMMLL